MSSMIIVCLALLGLIFGSFANATMWRLHEQSRKTARKHQKNDQNLSILTGRSQCTHCGHPLSAWDLVPVMSYLFLRGKCRYCRKPIEDTPVAELLTTLLFVASFVWWPLGLQPAGLTQGWVSLGFWLVMLVGFVILALYDIKWFLLPDRVVFPLIGLAVVELLVKVFVFHQGIAVIAAAFWGIVLIAGLFYGLHVISRGTWIGFGDVKLGIVLGLLVGGPLPALLVVFLSSLFGSLAAVPLLLQRKPLAKTRVPFGPFLILATVVVMLFGKTIIAWYIGLLSPLG